jgi:hypothetical protein
VAACSARFPQATTRHRTRVVSSKSNSEYSYLPVAFSIFPLGPFHTSNQGAARALACAGVCLFFCTAQAALHPVAPLPSLHPGTGATSPLQRLCVAAQTGRARAGELGSLPMQPCMPAIVSGAAPLRTLVSAAVEAGIADRLPGLVSQFLLVLMQGRALQHATYGSLPDWEVAYAMQRIAGRTVTHFLMATSAHVPPAV